MGGHGREHESQEFEHFPADFRTNGSFERLGPVNLVCQFHYEGDGGIEMPACLEIGGDAAESLVRFAEQALFFFVESRRVVLAARCSTNCFRVFVDEPEYAVEEAPGAL